MPHVEQEQPMIPDYLSLSPCFSGVRAARFLVFSVERKKKNTEITTSTSDWLESVNKNMIASTFYSHMQILACMTV